MRVSGRNMDLFPASQHQEVAKRNIKSIKILNGHTVPNQVESRRVVPGEAKELSRTYGLQGKLGGI